MLINAVLVGLLCVCVCGGGLGGCCCCFIIYLSGFIVSFLLFSNCSLIRYKMSDATKGLDYIVVLVVVSVLSTKEIDNNTKIKVQLHQLVHRSLCRPADLFLEETRTLPADQR